MADCAHRSCGTQEKVWLPYIYEGGDSGFKQHPYCAECGLVNNLSSEWPHQIGHFINMIALIRQRYKVAQVQVRLLVLEMQRQNIEDAYGMDRRHQESLFLDLANRYLNVPARAITELLAR
jgi:hypothetical protein